MALAREALLLDVGGPLLRLPFEFVDALERGFGLAPGTISWCGPFHPEGDPRWQDREAGRLGDREYWALWVQDVKEASGRTGSLAAFLTDCYRHAGVDAVRRETASLVVEARAAGIKVAALSNDVSWFYPDDFLERFPILSQMDAVIDLTDADVRKPEPRAYLLAAELLGVPAPHVVFVDDHAVNVAGAREAGVCGVYFDVTDVDGSIRQTRDALYAASP
jgi:putative hydrolase of the HAD superfamily